MYAGDHEGGSPDMYAAKSPGPHDATFTVFVVQPGDHVCTLRNVPSGICIFDLKGRLELASGVPCQVYQLEFPDGHLIPDEQRLHVGGNIQDGHLIKMRLYEKWESLYTDIYNNNIDHVVTSGDVHEGGVHVAIGAEEAAVHEAAVRERDSVALYMASFIGHHNMVNMLLTAGVDVSLCTPFGRTCLHAAVSADHVAVLDLLLKHGAPSQRTDYHGCSPSDVAYQMKSTGCAKKLRLLRLNLRCSSGMSTDRVTKQCYSRDDGHLDNEKEDNGRPASVIETERARSNMSHYSAHGGNCHHLRHETSRKCVSSASNVHDDAAKKHVKTQHSSMENLKRSVRWGENHGAKVYCDGTIVGSSGHLHSPMTVSVKPVALLRQKKLAKVVYDQARDVKPVDRGAAATNDVEGNGEQHRSSASTPSGQSRARYIYHKTSREWTNMRRKINIAAKANSGISEEKKIANDVAFKYWLRKKREEAEEADQSEVSSDDNIDSDDDIDKLAAFNKWVRKYNRQENTNMHRAPRNQTPRDVISVRSTLQGDSRSPSAHLHIIAHRDWQKKRRFGTTPIKRRTLGDIKVEQRQLEEKRQKLLLQAISYDEWMDHAAERKFLVKQILKADMQDMKKLEEDKDNDRARLHSYAVWNEKMKARQAETKRRKGIIRLHEEQQTDRRVLGRSSAAVTFQDWMDAKRRETTSKGKSKTPTPVKQQRQSTNEQWLLDKHRENLAYTGSQTGNDHEFIKLLRERRAASAVS